jgi:hypothetical protein
MDLLNYLGLKVKILLKNNYYYVGLVLNADENSIDLKDIKGQNVSLAKESILSIQEVAN